MRRLASLAFIALVVASAHANGGCSLDWTIGSGSTTDPTGAPGALPTSTTPPSSPPDSGAADTGAPIPSGAKECPNGNCECKDDKTCVFVCTTAACQLKCSENSKCTLTCPRGAACAMDCSDRADCTIDCSAGGSQCPVKCEDNATCRGSCKAGSICTRDCPSKRCNIDCTGGGVCP